MLFFEESIFSPPAVDLFTAANGRPSARGNGISLFSPYDPERDAKRFVDAALAGKKPSCVILLGAGLGYLENAVSRLLPEAAVVSVCFDRALVPPRVSSGRLVWFPSCHEGLEAFLEQRLAGETAEEAFVIEWPASSRAFPELAKRARREVLRVLRENAYGALTTAAAGRLWFRNALANFLLLETPLAGRLLDPGLPVVIAASGPSLAQSLPLLAKRRGSINLWALPSSLEALQANGLEPDLVAATDAGYYAARLLDSWNKLLPLLAMPFSAARGSFRRAAGVFLFTQPGFFEEELGRAIGKEGLTRLPAHGTVAGSALALALRSGAREIVFCGLDLCHEDIRGHVSPHPFTTIFAAGSTRFEPHYSQTYRHAVEAAPRLLPGNRARVSRAHAIYAASFADASGGLPARLWRLFSSAQAVPGLENLDEAGLVRLLDNARPSGKVRSLRPVAGYPDREKRRLIAEKLFQDWERAVEEGINRLMRSDDTGFLRAQKRLSELVMFLGGRAGFNLLQARAGSKDDESGAAARDMLWDMKGFLAGVRQRLLTGDPDA